MDENDKSAEENDETTLESDADTTIEDMEKFLTVYNAFIQQVMEFEWPDEHPLTEDPKMQRMLFQMFWQQRHRQRMNDERMERRRNRESNGDEEDFNFKAASKENFKRFLRHQMDANNDDDESEDEYPRSLTLVKQHPMENIQQTKLSVAGSDFEKSGNKNQLRIPVA